MRLQITLCRVGSIYKRCVGKEVRVCVRCCGNDVFWWPRLHRCIRLYVWLLVIGWRTFTSRGSHDVQRDHIVYDTRKRRDHGALVGVQL